MKRLVICSMLGALVASGCSRDEPASTPDFGALMFLVGQRFERMGRAAHAERFELAAFEARELGEVFEKDLPRARLPHGEASARIPELLSAFARSMPTRLEQAANSRDRATFDAAFSAASEECNGCHRASGRGFIEIPSKPELPVPTLDPAKGDAGAR